MGWECAEERLPYATGLMEAELERAKEMDSAPGLARKMERAEALVMWSAWQSVAILTRGLT